MPTRSPHHSLFPHAQKWGLIPHWSKGKEDFSTLLKTINARGETVSSKPTYRGLVKTHRCVVLADGYVSKAKTGFLRVRAYARANLSLLR